MCFGSLLIVIKDVFLSLLSFLNKSKNLMDRTPPCKLLIYNEGCLMVDLDIKVMK
nr:succinate dehydrogenase subunit 4 [Angelica dahurica]